MDERQQQIKAGAGLEESRINEDFKEFLEKWGTWLLLAVAVAFGSLWGFQKLEERRIAKVNDAFAAYEAASGSANPSPEALVRVAEEYEGVRAVSELARLRSADIYLHAARSGLRPGAEYTPEGELASEDDLLSADRIGQYLDQAQALFGQVFENAEASGSVLAIDAAFGLGAVGESKGDEVIAKRGYEAARDSATKHGRPILARVATERLDAISGGIPELITLHADADLPELPRYVPPTPDPIETQIPVTDGGLPALLPEEGGEQAPDEAPEGGGAETPADAPADDAGEPADPEAAGDDAP